MKRFGINGLTYTIAGIAILLLSGCLEPEVDNAVVASQPVPPPSGDNPPPTGNEAPTAVISATPTSGVAALTVEVDASQSTSTNTITSYSWDFGDGMTSEGQTAAHVYSQSGGYSITLAVSDDQGLADTASTMIHVFDSIDNSQVIVPQAVTFYDDFQYEVSRGGSASYSREQNPFVQSGGWHNTKAVNISGSHNGYLYTASDIPGYSGDFPGRNSTSVLAIEGKAGSMGDASGMTDFYLQYGSHEGSRETIPGNVWFQFWLYPNNYDAPSNQSDQLSRFANRFKFIYPCNTGYPCTSGNARWKTMLGALSYEPLMARNEENGAFLFMMDQERVARYLPAPPANDFKLGQTNISEHLAPNRWTLVKIHYDTSTVDGVFEAWLKPMGGEWVKVAEWINGVTPDFTWSLDLADIGGHRTFRMPTVVNEFDSWIYLDDFAMATSEEDLPVYPY